MDVVRAMRRVRRVREMEEEQRRAVLESALVEQAGLEAALEAARQRERAGRRLVTEGAVTGEWMNRVAGVEEMQAGRRKAEMLGPPITGAEENVAARRADFLEKRTERRQVQLLIEQREEAAAREEERRGQRSTDDWFLNRRLEGREASATGRIRAEDERDGPAGWKEG